MRANVYEYVSFIVVALGHDARHKRVCGNYSDGQRFATCDKSPCQAVWLLGKIFLQKHQSVLPEGNSITFCE